MPQDFEAPDHAQYMREALKEAGCSSAMRKPDARR